MSQGSRVWDGPHHTRDIAGSAEYRGRKSRGSGHVEFEGGEASRLKKYIYCTHLMQHSEGACVPSHFLLELRLP